MKVSVDEWIECQTLEPGFRGSNLAVGITFFNYVYMNLLLKVLQVRAQSVPNW